MRAIHKALALAAIAGAMALPAMAGDVSKADADKFVTMCDKDKDGMMSKQEMLQMFEKMFDKHDTKKMGKLDKKQSEDFLKDLLKGSG